MRIYLIIFFSIICFISKAQNIDTSLQYNIILLPDYYKVKGVVFSKNYKIGLEFQNIKHRYTPSKDDIIKAENILYLKYNYYRKDSIDTKIYFCNWVRQYFGIIDGDGRKNIIIQLIDNEKPKKLNRLLGKDWETSFLIYFADPYPSLGICLRINLETGEISEKL